MAWLSLVTVAQPARAQREDSTPTIDVGPDVIPGVTAESLRDAIARELRAHAPRGAGRRPRSRGVITVTRIASGQARVSYRDAQREVTRELELPTDATAAVAAVTWITGNLARNEVDELLEDLRASASAPDASDAGASDAASDVGATDASIDVATVAPGDASTAPDAAATAPTPAAAPATPPPVPPAPAPPPPVAPPPTRSAPPSASPPVVPERPRYWMLSLEAHASTVPVGAGYEPIVPAHLAIAYSLSPALRVGISTITFAAAASSRTETTWSVGAGPFAELRGRWRAFEPFVQAGIAFQWRFGQLASGFGIAAHSAVGLRLRLGEVFSFGIGARGYMALSERFLFTPTIVPRGAIVLSAGIELGVHF